MYEMLFEYVIWASSRGFKSLLTSLSGADLPYIDRKHSRYLFLVSLLMRLLKFKMQIFSVLDFVS